MSYQDRRWLQCVVMGFLLFGAACSVFAQPNVGEFSPRGLEAGGVTRLVFQGAGFDAETRLLAKFPIAEQTLVGDATGQRLTMLLNLLQVSRFNSCPWRFMELCAEIRFRSFLFRLPQAKR